jgi:ABC-type enterochelin transport system permease subunit
MLATLGFNVRLWENGSDFINLTPFYLEQSIGGAAPTLHYVPYMFIAALCVAAATLAVIEITRYNNRLLQIKLGALNSLFMAATVVLMFVFSNQIAEEQQAQGQLGIALFLPVAAMIFNLLANRFIRKDEKLVRSVDRIR